MKWIINYVDVGSQEPLTEVEERCFQGWEPFAITWVPMPSSGTRVILSRLQRFWFKKRVKKD